MKNWNKLIQKIWKRIFFNLNSVKKKKNEEAPLHLILKHMA